MFMSDFQGNRNELEAFAKRCRCYLACAFEVEPGVWGFMMVGVLSFDGRGTRSTGRLGLSTGKLLIRRCGKGELMPQKISAADRLSLIRLASSLPKGSDERIAILSGLRKIASPVRLGPAITDEKGLKALERRTPMLSGLDGTTCWDLVPVVRKQGFSTDYSANLAIWDPSEGTIETMMGIEDRDHRHYESGNLLKNLSANTPVSKVKNEIETLLTAFFDEKSLPSGWQVM